MFDFKNDHRQVIISSQMNTILEPKRKETADRGRQLDE